MLSHGLATTALRARVKTPLGIALNFLPAHPASDGLEAQAAARREDVPVEGYTLRYGLCHVDFASLERRPKDSAKFLREVCRRG